MQCIIDCNASDPDHLTTYSTPSTFFGLVDDEMGRLGVSSDLLPHGYLVAGPVAASEAAEELRVAMYDWEKTGMDWSAAALREGHGRLTECDERFKQAWQAKRAPDRACQQAARRALGTDEP